MNTKKTSIQYILVISLLGMFLISSVKLPSINSQSNNEIEDLIKGTWVTTYDEDEDGIFELWKFDGTHLTMGTTQPGNGINNQENIANKERYTVGNSCASSSSGATALLDPSKTYLNILDSKSCYLIRSIDSVYLEVVYEARGNIISFKKQ